MALTDGLPAGERGPEQGGAGPVILPGPCNAVTLGFQEVMVPWRGDWASFSSALASSLSLSLFLCLSLPGVSSYFAPSRRRSLRGSREQNTQLRPAGSSPLAPEPLATVTPARTHGSIPLVKMEESRPSSCRIRSCW